ncbi:hypothetical protein IJ162_02055 [Candidatus Saccharibacteria bacterium]|nr:hypothetical protein [Candidatus Saccharibacteria bacterium]
MPRAKKTREEIAPMEATEQNLFETEAVPEDTVEATESIQTEPAPTEPVEAPVEAEAPKEVPVIVLETEAEEAAETGETAPFEPAGIAPADSPETEENGVIHLTLSLPVSMFEQSPGSMQRLKAAIGSKQTLLKKALGTDSLNVVIEEDRVTFPWFTLTSEDNSAEVDAYSRLVFALSKKAITQTRVDPVEKVPDDLQLGMRLYLINLEFKGDEFKSARAILMKNFAKNGGGSAKNTKYELTMPEVYKP